MPLLWFWYWVFTGREHPDWIRYQEAMEYEYAKASDDWEASVGRWLKRRNDERRY